MAHIVVEAPDIVGKQVHAGGMAGDMGDGLGLGMPPVGRLFPTVLPAETPHTFHLPLCLLCFSFTSFYKQAVPRKPLSQPFKSRPRPWGVGRAASVSLIHWISCGACGRH